MVRISFVPGAESRANLFYHLYKRACHLPGSLLKHELNFMYFRKKSFGVLCLITRPEHVDLICRDRVKVNFCRVHMPVL
jgi:hypothetical protein